MHSINVTDDGNFNIIGNFIKPINLTSTNYSDDCGEESDGLEFIYQVDYIYDLIKFTSFEDEIDGINNTRNVKRQWRIKREDSDWTDWIDLELGDFREFPELTSKNTHSIQIKWTRTGSNPGGFLSIKGFTINGEWDRGVVGEPVLSLPNLRDPAYVRTNEIFKVFSIEDFEIISRGITNDRTLTIHYRFSQDTGRTWTDWEELTKENISTARISPIRFFLIEYKLERGGTDIEGSIDIYDINLIGDFQNVNQDYFKTNLLGVRECCNENNLDETETPSTIDTFLSDAEKEGLFDPYALNKATDLYNKMSRDTNEVFGHEVTYFVTQPDNNAIDKTFHEYQLYNVTCTEDIKVSVQENQFPDNQIVFNQFDLSLFETFEIHIPKDVFKQAFGVDKRPSKEDFLWFCQLNRMYQVEHAQPFRDFNNSAVYYKVILKKYNQKSSVRAGDDTIKDRIEELTKNSTIDELMGIENKEDKKDVAYKDQNKTLTKDPIRSRVNASIEKELIDNASLVISKYHYNMIGITPGEEVVTYKSPDSYVAVSDNRAFSFWFNIPEYVANETYNFLNNYDDDNNLGYKLNLINGKLRFTINQSQYELDVSQKMDDNIWFCWVVNVDQRKRKISQFLYKRDVDNENLAHKLNTSKLRLLEVSNEDYEIQEFEFDNNIEISIKASDMKLTNIRIYNDIVPMKTHNKVLNQNIVRDARYIILADNANKQLKLDNFPYGTEEPKK